MQGELTRAQLFLLYPMATLNILRLRHLYACLQRPVAHSDIEKIVEAAQRVPSWCNAQPWQLILCEGAQTKILAAALTAAAKEGLQAPEIPFPESYSGKYKHRRSTCGWQLYEAVGVAKGDRAASRQQMLQNYRFFNAPQVAILTIPKELGAYAALDAGAFVTAFTLAAQALGIATIAQAAIAGMAPILRENLQIEADRDILCAVSFGYEDKHHPANAFRTKRAGVHEVLRWHKPD